MALSPDKEGVQPDIYSSLEAVDGKVHTGNINPHEFPIPAKLLPDSTLPEALFKVDRDAPEVVNVTEVGEHPNPKGKICGVPAKMAFIIFAVLILILTAIGGGVGGALSKKHHANPTGQSTAPLITTGGNTTANQTVAVQLGTRLSAIQWGYGREYHLRLYYQGNDSFIYESIFSAGVWNPSRRLVKAKLLTSIASMFYPPDGTGNKSVK
jgi:hypothetical protein